MKRFLVCVLGLLGAVIQANEPKDPNELHNFLYKQASDLVQPYLILHGTSPKDATSAKARAELNRSIDLFERVLTLNDQNWPAAWLAGKAAQSLKDPERAYLFFRRAFDIQKKNPDVARELMMACLDTKRAKEGVSVAEHAVQLSDADAGLKANLALARLCAGNVPGAEEAIDASLKQNPSDSISITLKRLIGEVKRGERKQPETPRDLEK